MVLFGQDDPPLFDNDNVSIKMYRYSDGMLIIPDRQPQKGLFGWKKSERERASERKNEMVRMSERM